MFQEVWVGRAVGFRYHLATLIIPVSLTVSLPAILRQQRQRDGVQ